MVKLKQQKSKPNQQQQPNGKKKGKDGDIDEVRAQLEALGLKIVEVTADGNCFFRALADQLEGNEEEHQKYRTMVVKFIEKSREMFEPFIEDEVPFDEYCRSMEKDGTWAGHMELQAASLVTHTNICIHKSMSPRWYIRNFNDSGAHMVHLSYHDGLHYNSVRLKEDTCSGPARPIIIKADAGLSATYHQEKTIPNKSRPGHESNLAIEKSIKMVMVGSGCTNEEKVKKVLLEVDCDTDAAIEFLIAEQGDDDLLSQYIKVSINDSNGILVDEHSDCIVVDDHDSSKDRQLSPRSTSISKDNKTDRVLVDMKFESRVVTGSSDEIFESFSVDNNDSIIGIKKLQSRSKQSPNEFCVEKDSKVQKIPRNKNCPCGSKKKYKSCCGTATGKSSMQFPVSSNSKKDKKQGKKSVTSKVATANGPDGKPPDVGALCI